MRFTLLHLILVCLLLAPFAAAAPVWTLQQTEPNSSLQWQLEGYWNFDDGSTNDSIHSWDFNDVHTENATGIRGSARLFNAGQQDYLWYPDNNIFSWNLTADADMNYTWVVWVNMVDTTPMAGYALLAKDAVDREWVWSFEDTRAFIYHRDGANSMRAQLDTPTVLNQGEGDWYQLAVRYYGTQTSAGLDWFVNGTQQATSDFDLGYTQAQNLNVNLLVGAANVTGSTTQYWDGLMDEMIFYTRALNDSELLTLYGNGTPIQPLPQTVYTNYNESLIGGFDYLRFLNFTGLATTVEVNDSRATVVLDGQTVNLTFSPVNVNRTYVINVTLSDGTNTDLLEITYNITNQDFPAPQINATPSSNASSVTVNIDLKPVSTMMKIMIMVIGLIAVEASTVPILQIALPIIMVAYSLREYQSTNEVLYFYFIIVCAIYIVYAAVRFGGRRR